MSALAAGWPLIPIFWILAYVRHWFQSKPRLYTQSLHMMDSSDSLQVLHLPTFWHEYLTYFSKFNTSPCSMDNAIRKGLEVFYSFMIECEPNIKTRLKTFLSLTDDKNKNWKSFQTRRDVNLYHYLFIDYLWYVEVAPRVSLTADVFPMRLRQSCKVGEGTPVVYSSVCIDWRTQGL